MGRSLSNSPQQLRILALTENAGMKGIRSAAAVAGELALLPLDQQTKARKHIITANVCHALRKLSKRGLLVIFTAPSERYYISSAVLRAEDAIRNTQAVGQTCEIMIVDEVQAAEPIEQQPIEQHTAVEAQPETASSLQSPEDWLELIRRGCTAAAKHG